MLRVLRSRVVPASPPVPGRPFAEFDLPVPHDEWMVAITARPNLLLEGAPHVTHAIVRALAPHLKPPIALFNPSRTLQNPSTLIVDDPAALTVTAQHHLLEWLDDRRRDGLQVIATAPRALFAAVEHGAFLPALYYRLNVVRLYSDANPF